MLFQGNVGELGNKVWSYGTVLMSVKKDVNNQHQQAKSFPKMLFFYCTRVKTHKLLQTCKQVVTRLLTSCTRTPCSKYVGTSLEQA